MSVCSCSRALRTFMLFHTLLRDHTRSKCTAKRGTPQPARLCRVTPPMLTALTPVELASTTADRPAFLLPPPHFCRRNLTRSCSTWLLPVPPRPVKNILHPESASSHTLRWSSESLARRRCACSSACAARSPSGPPNSGCARARPSHRDGGLCDAMSSACAKACAWSDPDIVCFSAGPAGNESTSLPRFSADVPSAWRL